ncbi:UDP-N-acetylmuramate dehydrogenase [Herbaspirillum sp. AP02]|uniref:UDP-N-acetylmuramate dehydrogenase n=1 Tax=unclassified Herbaspirillum TaxID=2624150 RepID=UPI0015DB5EA1|nr:MULTISPECIES: UDP-N-acetylmuramate dehydrogenase [unclassified Herbaspirillum]MBG7619760.1 UDP-N-acetylmuramate dehydrogenase [Herbaspirillum sp. AP02]NZD69831.1 UDP-N-acetylmuramate dehydrogenase [Herbaspirillum sp. AP21]
MTTSSLPVQHAVSLRAFNTFGIEAQAHAYLPVDGAEILQALRADVTLMALPRLVLGGGSNLLLTQDFSGLVLHMQGRGMAITGHDEDFTYVCAAAGESWHSFVQWTLAQGLGGLENLSLIPGSVGAAPIQNIGAYGIELKDRFHSLRAFDLDRGEILTLDREACRFGYRDSVFKHALRDRAVVLDVSFALPRRWVANANYADVAQALDQQGITEPGPRDIAEAVIAIRTRKLPDPARIGNAGSFFKNPIVPTRLRDRLLAQYANLVSYRVDDDHYKLAAGWLIDRCGWKGKSMGRAGVYEQQALVLVNRGGASGAEIARLAKAIQDDVLEKFGVQLEPEPVFI